MYPKNSRFSGLHNDFEDDFYESFNETYDDGDYEDIYDDDAGYSGSNYNGRLYSSDYDYGINTVDIADVCSFTECTGMVARGTGEPDELSEYKEMFNFGTADDDE